MPCSERRRAAPGKVRGRPVSSGSTVHDTATPSGASAGAGGTVTYTVFTDTACSAGAQAAGVVTVSIGTVPNSNTLTFTTAGDYCWQAVYSGDANNSAATSAGTSEHLASPSATTAQTVLPNDSFALSGGYSATGTVSFKLFAPADATCSGSPAYVAAGVALAADGTAATSNSTFIASTEGTRRWLVTYSGDDNNNPVTKGCGVEQFTILNHWSPTGRGAHPGRVRPSFDLGRRRRRSCGVPARGSDADRVRPAASRRRWSR